MMRPDRKFTYNAQTTRDGEKVCARCRRWGVLTDFPPSRLQSSGLSSWCRPCHVAAVRDWRRRNRALNNARRREAYRRRRAAAATP
jgi:hypothetical protein